MPGAEGTVKRISYGGHEWVTGTKIADALLDYVVAALRVHAEPDVVILIRFDGNRRSTERRDVGLRMMLFVTELSPTVPQPHRRGQSRDAHVVALRRAGAR